MAREGRVHENGCGNNPWKDSPCSYISSSPSATFVAAHVTTRCISRRSGSRHACCTRSSPRPTTCAPWGSRPSSWACWGARAISCRRSPSSRCSCSSSWYGMPIGSCSAGASASSPSTSCAAWGAARYRSCSWPRRHSWAPARWRAVWRRARHCRPRSARSRPSCSTLPGGSRSPSRSTPRHGPPDALPWCSR